MNIKSFLLGILSLVAFSLQAQSVNTDKSVVNFEISNMGVKTVKGSFTGMTGKVSMQNNNISNIEVCIDPNTVNTENEKRDEHLKNEDFFEVDKYKTICFTSTSILKTEGGYTAKGKLTMHGVTKEVSIPLTLSNNTLTGNLTIDRYDYKVGDDGSFMVGREVEMTITCVLNKSQS